MPTQKRIWWPGSSCHIISRGNHRENIFKDTQDFKYYLALIKEGLNYFGVGSYEIICYCLMDNHVHLLLETKDKPPGYLIGRINSIYAKYFNKKYDCVGHLFQDRYRIKYILKDIQMIETSRYIHLNHVRAKMVSKPHEYKWSSYNMYIGNKKEEIICSNKVLEYFRQEDKRDSYKKFVESVI